MWMSFIFNSDRIPLMLSWLIPPPSKTFVLHSVGNPLNIYILCVIGFLPPWVSIVVTFNSSRAFKVDESVGVSSEALWKVTCMLPASYITFFINSSSTSNFELRLPTTTPLVLNYLQTMTSSIISLFSSSEYWKPLLWCLMMMLVGIETFSKDFLMIEGEGVTPPISNALTNSILWAPQSSMVTESCGQVDMT